MEKLADYNLELCLLQLKYEHLSEMCRNVLKPWPTTNTKIPDTKEKQCSEDSVVVEEDSVTSVMEVSEWEHLQSLLTKAQKVYAYESNEKPSLTLASTTCGSDCSHGIVKQVDKSSSASFRSGLKSRSGSHSRAKLSQTESKSKTVSHCKSKTNVNNKPSESGLRKTAKHPKVLDALGVSVHCQVGVKHSSLRLDSVSRSHPSDRTHSGSGGKASKCKFTRTQEPKTQQGFSIQQNGTQLSMPSKYYRLQKSIYRWREELEDDPPVTSKAAATHFLKRLQSKDSHLNCLNFIALQLAVERTQLLKARLELITPGELSKRSSWQNVLHMKTELDLIKQSYHSVLNAYNHNSSSPTATPSQEPAGLEIDIAQLTSSYEAIKLDAISPSSPSPLIFSSLDEWSNASKTEQLKKHRQWEVKYLTAVEENILPLVSRCMNSPSPGPEWTSKAVSMIRTLHLVSQVPSKPIYLDSEQVIE